MESHPRRSLASLPKDVLLKVGMHVTSSSSDPITDIGNLTLTSFRQVNSEKMVERCVAIDREYSHMMWGLEKREKYMDLLRRCVDAGNPKANCILGVQHLSKHGERSAGISRLFQAKEGGHEAAAYILGMVQFQEANTRAVGVELLNKLAIGCSSCLSNDSRSIEPGQCLILHCWRKVAYLSGWGTFWKLPNDMSLICENGACKRIVERGWKLREELNRTFCSPLYRWAYEYKRLKLIFGDASW